MSVGRGEVERWRWGGGRDAPAARSRAIANAMAPAALHREMAAPDARRAAADRRARRSSSPIPAEEAQAIALALREALEEPGRTAALVTPDRALARRVSAHLRRWGIEADDSAGRPLSQTPPGTLLLAAANAAAERFAPVRLARLAQASAGHGAAATGSAGSTARALLDLMLRGPRPAAGLDGIAAHLADGGGRDGDLRAEAAAWWSDVMPLLRPLEAVAERRSEPCRPARRGARGGDARWPATAAWAGPAGRAAAETARRASRRRRRRGPSGSRRRNLPALLERLLADVAVRPPYGQHPRLFIWGLIEARLQHADLLVLGGLNEGTWPALPAPDPWLAPRLRADLGLPSLERRIGLAAHDFAAALGAPRGAGHPRPPRRPRAGHRLALLAEAGGDDRRADPLARCCGHGRGRSTGRRASRCRPARPAPAPDPARAARARSR